MTKCMGFADETNVVIACSTVERSKNWIRDINKFQCMTSELLLGNYENCIGRNVDSRMVFSVNWNFNYAFPKEIEYVLIYYESDCNTDHK